MTRSLDLQSSGPRPLLHTHAEILFFCCFVVLAYATTATGVCLHLLVPPCALLCFLLNITICIYTRKLLLQQLHSKKWSGSIYKGRLFLEDSSYIMISSAFKAGHFI